MATTQCGYITPAESTVTPVAVTQVICCRNIGWLFCPLYSLSFLTMSKIAGKKKYVILVSEDVCAFLPIMAA